VSPVPPTMSVRRPATVDAELLEVLLATVVEPVVLALVDDVEVTG